MPVTDTRTVELPPQLTLVVRGRITAAQTGRIPEWLQQTLEAIRGRGQHPSGMPFVRVLQMDDAGMDLEAGWPVAERLSPAEGLETSELPGGLTAVATYLGPYDAIGPAYQETFDWCRAHGLAVRGAPWESYLTDPHEEPDPTRWRTEIHIPVEPAAP